MSDTEVFREHNYNNSMLSLDSQKVIKPVWDLSIYFEGSDHSISYQQIEVIVKPDPLKQRFQHLAKTWRDECAHLSSIRETALHPAYQQIIGMGKAALPFILEELKREPNHWFWALRAITQENPVSQEHQGDVSEMVSDWLRWAETEGIR